MRWTTTPPTEPGWYWWREPRSPNWNIVEMYRGGDDSLWRRGPSAIYLLNARPYSGDMSPYQGHIVHGEHE